ncbi:MAG: radical SAM protein [Lachnospiraceae bacterium]|nr:radical SAM protein [Lachnospiraceae bacterium]
MKLCRRGVHLIQIINAQGDVRVCGWNCNNIIGNILKDDFRTIMHSERAESVRKPLIEQTYTDCPADNCPYLANKTMGEHLIELDEIPDYPEELYLGYEGVCNYNCTCCTSKDNMDDARTHDYEENYRLIAEKLKPILPRVKKISANGRGELFASRHIMELLAQWEPEYPAEECSVILETNGSLFNEKNWEKISNLGKYHLKVAITIMSFDEMIYRHLSGTKLPISNIESNLRFVKSLREKGIINELELATVLQEENFREMPEFTRRCIEEFGADCVRIRPIRPGGCYDKNIQWFMDVRNPRHPYYHQYKEIMSNPIFKNPKVLLWSGELDSCAGRLPAVEELEKKQQELLKNQKIQRVVDCILTKCSFANCLEAQNLKSDKYVIYGIGTIGKLLIRLYKDKIQIEGALDIKGGASWRFDCFDVMKPCEKRESFLDANIIVTTYGKYEQIEKMLREYGYRGTIMNIFDIL